MSLQDFQRELLWNGLRGDVDGVKEIVNRETQPRIQVKLENLEDKNKWQHIFV